MVVANSSACFDLFHFTGRLCDQRDTCALRSSVQNVQELGAHCFSTQECCVSPRIATKIQNRTRPMCTCEPQKLWLQELCWLQLYSAQKKQIRMVFSCPLGSPFLKNLRRCFSSKARTLQVIFVRKLLRCSTHRYGFTFRRNVLLERKYSNKMRKEVKCHGVTAAPIQSESHVRETLTAGFCGCAERRQVMLPTHPPTGYTDCEAAKHKTNSFCVYVSKQTRPSEVHFRRSLCSAAEKFVSKV